MTAEHGIVPSAIAGMLVVGFVFLASSCDQSTSSAKLPTPSVAPSPTPASSLPAASPPPGGPAPAQLQGDWFLAPAAVDAILGHGGAGTCPSPPLTATNCFFLLNLTATTYHLEGTAIATGSGNVVVNGNEIDFFNGAVCGLQLPDGVGRYTWTLKVGVLSLTLISDPCSRPEYMANQSWRRTH